MAEAGAKVVVTDVGASLSGEGAPPGPGGTERRPLIEAASGRRRSRPKSVAAWDSAQRIVEAALDHFGRIDAVVNNAGIVRDGISQHERRNGRR